MAKKSQPQNRQQESSAFDSIVGPEMKRIAESVQGFADANKSLMLHGPTGVGKEHLARVYAERLGKQLHVVNCAEFTEELMISEIFGHTKGAFTGATKDRKGILPHVAEKEGILLLDEFQELSAHMQARLLRVIETGEYRKLGEDNERNLESPVLFLAATSNMDDIRVDILYRFGFRFDMPSLEERRGLARVYRGRRKVKADPDEPMFNFMPNPEYWYPKKYTFHYTFPDLAATIEHCLIKATESVPNSIITEGALVCLYFKSWPGNFREIRNYIDACVIAATRDYDRYYIS